MGACVSVLPESLLSKISEKDRKSMGCAGMTASEAQEKFEYAQEKELQRDIRNFLMHSKCYFHQSPFAKKAQGKIGRADFLVCYRGRWISIEAKSMTGKQRPEQIKDQVEVESAGGEYLLARSIRDVQETFRRIDAEIRVIQEALQKDGWKLKQNGREVPGK